MRFMIVVKVVNGMKPGVKAAPSFMEPEKSHISRVRIDAPAVQSCNVITLHKRRSVD